MGDKLDIGIFDLINFIFFVGIQIIDKRIHMRIRCFIIHAKFQELLRKADSKDIKERIKALEEMLKITTELPKYVKEYIRNRLS
ncbi:MAG: hypothetical protein ACRCX2_23050 [Paraclostridium sp.]